MLLLVSLMDIHIRVGVPFLNLTRSMQSAPSSPSGKARIPSPTRGRRGSWSIIIRRVCQWCLPPGKSQIGYQIYHTVISFTNKEISRVSGLLKFAPRCIPELRKTQSRSGWDLITLETTQIRSSAISNICMTYIRFSFLLFPLPIGIAAVLTPERNSGSHPSY